MKKKLTEKLLLEWNYEKNVGLNPNDFSCGSDRKVWWICKNDHEWEATINSRYVGNNCPYCAGQKAIKGINDLSITMPNLLKEWDYDKNKGLNPSDFMKGSHKKVWWLCENKHSYLASIKNRSYGQNCPYCSNEKILAGFNDLATTNPYLAKEWDYEKNGSIKPSDVFAGGNKKIWWKCSNGHSYQAILRSRSQGTGCPYCAKSLKSSFPEQAFYYYLKKEFPDAINGYKNRDLLGSHMEFDIYIPSLKVAIEYDGKAYHSNTASIIRDQKKYDLCKKNKIILVRIKEMHRTSSLFMYQDHQIEIPNTKSEWLNWAIHELCFHLDKYVYPDVDRDRNKIIKYLDKRKTNLLDSYPSIAKEWNYEKNYPLTPKNVPPHTNIKVWWKCFKCGNEWEARINNRTSRSDGCPLCSKKKLIKSAIPLSKYSAIVSNDWNYEKNDDLTPDKVASHSTLKVWWKCSRCGEEWEASISSRIRGYNKCPVCFKRKFVPKNDPNKK